MLFINIVMKICNVSSQGFGANFINKTKILKNIENTRSYNECEAVIAKIDVTNINDIKALDKVAKYWQDSKFALNIYYAACAKKDNSKYYKDNDIFVLSSQTRDFDKLDSEKILGLLQVNKMPDKSMFIEHIEVKPSIINTVPSVYKECGTQLLNFLKSITEQISCFPSCTKTVKNFYRKNDFQEIPANSNLFIWKK